MSEPFQRGLVLFSQGRYDLADREFRRGLADEPDNALAHALLALCLAGDRGDEALAEADEAIRLDPTLAFCHYAKGRVLYERDRLKEAEAAAEEAIRLDPADADYLGLRATIAFGRRRWAEALEAAERGLALDPEHAICTNFRAMALVQLGRKDEAAEVLGSALADDPENALTHANQGWTLLHRGDHAKALEHFREALRLDPELDWARVGIVEALKARHWVYRMMLRFFLWMGRQGALAQWAVILGLAFGPKVLADLARAVPRLEPFVGPFLALTFGFLLLTWISSPLFNFLLQFNRFGRLALSRDQRVEANAIGGCFALAVACFAATLIRPGGESFLAMLFFGFLLPPLAVTFRQAPGRPRRLLAAYTGVLVLLTVPLLSLIVLGPASPWRDARGAFALFRYFLLGSILSTWIPALLGLRRLAD